MDGQLGVNVCKTHGRILSMSLKPSGVLQPEGMCACARSSSALSLVQVMWTRRCSGAPPTFSVPPAPSVSSSSSEPMLVKRSIEFLSLTNWAYIHTYTHTHILILHTLSPTILSWALSFLLIPVTHTDTLTLFFSVSPSLSLPLSSFLLLPSALCMGLRLIVSSAQNNTWNTNPC